MPPRFRLSLSLQMFLATALGILLGALLERGGKNSFGTAGLQACDFVASVLLVSTQAIALPLIFSSTILGAVGLEPMRGLGRKIGKTLLWIAASSLLAALTGLGVLALIHRPLFGHWFDNAGNRRWMVDVLYFGLMGPNSSALWQLWFSVILVSLVFGYYRNQIEDGHARLIARFCQALDEMLMLFIPLASRFLPVGALALAASWTARQGNILYHLNDILPFVVTLAVGWCVYGLVILPGALWWFTRTNPWQYLRLLAPALWIALVSGSPAVAVPFTLDAVCRRAGISNRVAGPVLSLCAGLHRDGLALVWTLTIATTKISLGDSVAETINAWVTGCGSGAARTWVTGFYFNSEWDMPAIPWVWQAFVLSALVWIVCSGAAAVSVWSHACAVAVIAHSEGERHLLSPAPPKDPLAFDDSPADGV